MSLRCRMRECENPSQSGMWYADADSPGMTAAACHREGITDVLCDACRLRVKAGERKKGNKG